MYRVRLLCPADRMNRSRPSQVVSLGSWGQAHRCARVAVADLLDRVGGQHPDGVDRGRIDLGPVVGKVRLGKGRDVFECGHERPRVDKVIVLHPSAGSFVSAGPVARELRANCCESTLD
jgi:hypothetical protein